MVTEVICAPHAAFWWKVTVGELLERVTWVACETTTEDPEAPVTLTLIGGEQLPASTVWGEVVNASPAAAGLRVNVACCTALVKPAPPTVRVAVTVAGLLKWKRAVLEPPRITTELAGVTQSSEKNRTLVEELVSPRVLSDSTIAVLPSASRDSTTATSEQVPMVTLCCGGLRKASAA